MTFKSTLVYALRCLAIIALIPGCHIVARFHSTPIGKDYECTTWIMNCKKQTQRPQPVVSQPPRFGTCYSTQPDLTSSTAWDGFEVGDAAFCDRPWKVVEIEKAELRGAARILTAQDHNEVDRADFLRFTWAPETEALFIAYDSRAAKKPDWLAPPTYRLAKDASNRPQHIRIASSDTPQGVELEIFERVFLSPPRAGQTISIPSNLNGNPGGWIQTTPHLSSMYMVIVQPRVDDDCSNPAPEDLLSPVITAGCFATEQLAKDYANRDCGYERGSKALTDQSCGQPVCVDKGGCAGEQVISELIGKRAFAAWSFIRSSEIEFDPAISKAEITVEGTKYSLGVKGLLHFEYFLDNFDRLRTLDLNAMYLELGTLSSAIGTFANIEVGLSQPTSAECQDLNPQWATPCDRYRIAGGDLVAKESAFYDGADRVFVAQSAGPLGITINHQTRSFRIQGGPLRTTIEVNGKDRDILTTIDLTGRFKNFEPHAVAKESTGAVECGVADTLVPSNAQPVYLNSAGSFDIYDSLAAAGFEWYEDFGLVTQRSWGQGPQTAIAPYQLGFGVHEMALVIRDPLGAMSSDTFEVEVRDSVPPSLSIPTDRYFLMTGPSGPVHIDLGQATASDSCNQDVAISNDAPKGSMFSPGLTTVTWTADDGGGNTTSAVQNVYVFETPDVDEPILLVEGYAKLIESVASTAKKTMAALGSCGLTAECEVGFEDLAGHLERLGATLAELEMTGEAAQLRGRVVERLEAVRAQLVEADEALARSEVAAGEASEMRSGALAAATGSDESLAEIAEMLRALAEEQEP